MTKEVEIVSSLTSDTLNLTMRAIDGFTYTWDSKNESIDYSSDLSEWNSVSKNVQQKLSNSGSPKDFQTLLHPDDLEKFQKNWIAAMKGHSEKLDLEYRFIADGGDYRWQRNVGTVLRDSKGRATSISGIAYDIHDFKTKEADSQRKEQRIFWAIEKMRDQVLVWDENDELYTFNESALKGFSALGVNLRPGLSYIEMQEALFDKFETAGLNEDQFIQKQIEKRKDSSGEARLMHLPSANIYTEATDTVLPDGGVITVLRDITREKEQELELRLSKERYANATSFLVVYEWDGNSKTFAISAGSNSGTEDRDIVSVGGEYLDRVHPEDREEYRLKFVNYLKGEIERFDVQYRRRTTLEAPFRWCRDRANAVRDNSGRTLKLYGVIEDIEESKSIQAALEKKLAR